ncbi:MULTISPECIES: acylphosphatase [Acinetobacter]|uniref:acylphosphatase n=1 Tax=Acinetobacter TaxID=469 RepID=UPI000EA0C149|nr:MULTISPECIES: acylphosphatase [Acinetobacter]RKG39329.1 acylphosphatase [Acinetobacter cumulans]RZG56198.1 acylphosphatase [Acinetobacter sp. WCHAc060006]
MNRKALKLCIHGQVQGVGYRRWFEQQAITLNLKGYVKNLSSGDVEAVIVGSELDISKMLVLCESGPIRAVVTAIESTAIAFDEAEFANFKMRR